MSLAALVSEYKREFAWKLEAELEHYAELPSLDEVIRQATVGVGADKKMHSHQHRLGYARLERQAKVFLNAARAIGACQSFDQLHDLLWSRRIPGVGRLACYDTAVRIGAFLELYPDVIYLHRGTRQGYRALGLKASGKIASVESLPKPLQKLSPSDLENFLCIFKDRFAGGKVGSCGPKRRRPGIC